MSSHQWKAKNSGVGSLPVCYYTETIYCRSAVDGKNENGLNLEKIGQFFMVPKTLSHLRSLILTK